MAQKSKILAKLNVLVENFTKRVRVGLRLQKRHLKRKAHGTRKRFARSMARFWSWVYLTRYHFLLWRKRYGLLATLFSFVVLIALSATWIPDAIQDSLEELFGTKAQIGGLRLFLLTIGGVLTGAVAIVSSLVLFAMQVNVERMPYGLFRKLGADRGLLSMFFATFLLGIVIAATSLVPMPRYIGSAVFVALWGIILVLTLFRFCYIRALNLVNPVRQLGFVLQQGQRELRAWGRRATRAAPLLSAPQVSQVTPNQTHRSQHDLARTAYFQLNPYWTRGAMQGIHYAASYARRSGERGDYEVTEAAFNAIIEINRTYIDIKGKTFFTQHLMFNNPLTTDGFINGTLENLRKTARPAVAARNEEQVTQVLKAIVRLVRLYARIDYADVLASKIHAHIAVRYLTDELDRIVPNHMPNVLMEGVGLMGICAETLLTEEGPSGITTLTEKLGVISCIGVAREDYQPVTFAGVEQLSRISIILLRTHSREVRFAAQEIRSSMKLIARQFMTLPDTPFQNIHSTYLGPYYSATTSQSLGSQLVNLANEVAAAPENDENAKQIIRNFEQWADGMYQTEKELLLYAIEKRSHFTFDLIRWITKVSSILLALSNAPACNDYTREKLRNHASWLMGVLSWIPDNKDIVTFVENLQFTEVLFESAIDARNRECWDIAEQINNLLLSWMFKAGKYQTEWPILERSVYGLATLALLSNDSNSASQLKEKIAERIAQDGLGTSAIRRQAAREILNRSASLHQRGHWSSDIEHYLAQTDEEDMRSLLEDIAELISPQTNC